MPKLFDRVVYFDNINGEPAIWYGIVAQVYDQDNVRVQVWNAPNQKSPEYFDAVRTDTPGTLYGWMSYVDA